MNLQSVNSQPCVIALGFFDGIHRGHIALLRETAKQAAERSISGKMLTFDPHPGLFFGRAVELLSETEDRIYLAKSLCGVETVVLPFDEAISQMSPERFADEILIARLGAVGVVAGENFTFGKDAAGNARCLGELCEQRGISFTCVPSVVYEGSPVSSTRIRKLIEAGNVVKAGEYLGHPHLFSGCVKRGKQLGRTLDFPTANLQRHEHVLLPAPGVYATRTALSDGQSFLSVTNVGTRPTVDADSTVTVETYLIGFDRDIYDQNIHIFFDSKIRDICRFPSPEALSEQIRADVACAQARAASLRPIGKSWEEG